MANFTTANLPGANESFNAARSKLDGIKGTLKSNMEVDASALTGTLNTDLLDFGDKLKSMIPELPDIPDLSLQAVLATFTELAGASAAQALSSLQLRFGGGVKDLGFDIDDLVSQAQDAAKSGQSIASKIPNITIPSAGGVAKLLPNNVKQADADAIEELVSEKVKTEITEEVKKKTVTNLEVKKTLVSYNSTEEVITSGGGSTTTFADGKVVRTDESGVETVIKESSLKPEGYLKKQDPEVDTVDTTLEAPAISTVSKAERMGLSEQEYLRYKELQKEGRQLAKQTRPARADRPAGPLAGNEEALERKEKVNRERKRLFQRGRQRKEVAKLEASGLTREQALDIVDPL